MNIDRFDRMAISLATPDSRRNIARLFAVLPFVGCLIANVFETSAADRRKGKQKRKGKKRKKTCARANQTPSRGRPCCKGLIRNDAGRCAEPPNCDVCRSGCQFSSIQAAIDARVPGSTITICPGSYVGNVTIAKDLTLIGADDGADPAGNSILQRDGSGRVVDISEIAESVTLQRLRITGGSTTEPGGGLRNRAAILALTDCTVTRNSAANAAGISSSGTATLTRCTISANTVTGGGNGGGISNSANMTLTNCTVTGNRAQSDGGGIISGSSGAVLTLLGSNVTGNHASNRGGGIINFGTVTCSGDSIVSGNTAGDPVVTSNCENTGSGDGCASCPL